MKKKLNPLYQGCRKTCERLEKENAEPRRALRDLADYTGGSDTGESHPCGRAAILLERLGA